MHALELGHRVADTIWCPDAPPLIPSSLDDEFADASGGVPSGWTEVDHGNAITVTETEAGLEMLSSPSATGQEAGIYKTIPAGDFTIWTKFTLNEVQHVNYSLAGLALWVDATDSAADAIFFYHYFGNNLHEVAVSHFNDYASFNSNLSTASQVYHSLVIYQDMYFRVRRNGTTYAFEMSSDGLGWTRFYSNTLPVTPTHFGPFHGRYNQANKTIFSFFRYKDSDIGLNGLCGGRRIKVYA